MLQFLRFSLTGLILLTAAPALAGPVFISEAHVGGGTNGADNVVNDFQAGSASPSAAGSDSASGALISGTAQAAASFPQLGGQASASLTNASIIGEGGTEYPGSVPEPQALLLLAPAGLALRRARRQR